MFVGLSSKWLIKLLVILTALSGFDSAELPMRRWTSTDRPRNAPSAH
jgi:hypothetical protein